MLSGFLSAFARAIIRRRDEELSVGGRRDFGNIRISTEGFAGGACGTSDEAALRCSTQCADLSTPIDRCALICGTRTLQMIYARILWLSPKLWMRSTFACHHDRGNTTMDAFGDEDELQRAHSAFPALDDDLDGFTSIPAPPTKSTSVSGPLDFDFEPALPPAVQITDDDEIGKFESQFPDIGGAPEVSSRYVFIETEHLPNSCLLVTGTIHYSTTWSCILSEPCVWYLCLGAPTSRVLPSTNLFPCIP